MNRIHPLARFITRLGAAAASLALLLPAASASADPSLAGRTFEARLVGTSGLRSAAGMPLCLVFGEETFAIDGDGLLGTWKKGKGNAKRTHFKLRLADSRGSLDIVLKLRGHLDTAGPGAAIAATGTLKMTPSLAQDTRSVALAGTEVEECEEEEVAEVILRR